MRHSKIPSAPTIPLLPKPRKPKLKKSPPSPHVEVVSESGTQLPIEQVEIQEDAGGIHLIRVKVRLPNEPAFSGGSGTFYSHNYNTTSW